MEFTGIVLAGGSSRRMGTDKAALVIDDESLLARVVRALTDAGADELVVVGGDPAAATQAGARHVVDHWPGEGPLGGLITGLSLVGTDLAVVCACDLPDVDPTVVRDLVATLAADERVDAVIPEVGGRAQPLLAAYRRRCADALVPAFTSGERRLDAALRDLAVERPVNDGPSFADLDTVADLEARRRR